MSRLLCLTELLRHLSPPRPPAGRQRAEAAGWDIAYRDLPGSRVQVPGAPRRPQSTDKSRRSKDLFPNGHGDPGHAEPRPSSRPPSATAGELVRNSTTPSIGAWISSCTVVPSMLVTVPTS